MTNAFLYRMGAGYPGAVTRKELAKVEPFIMDPDTPVEEFGVPVILSSGKIQPFAGSGTIIGFLVRPYPTQAEVNEALNAGTPNPDQICDVLRSGYMIVDCTDDNAAVDGAVYVNNTTGKIQASSSGATAVTGAKFKGTVDSNGFVEIEYNL